MLNRTAVRHAFGMKGGAHLATGCVMAEPCLRHETVDRRLATLLPSLLPCRQIRRHVADMPPA